MAGRWDKRRCMRVLLLVFGGVMVLGLAAPGWGESERWHESGESPSPPYWYRNVQGAGRQAGPMHPRLREITDAFGRGEYEQSRQLAEALLEATDDADPRSEAAGFMIEAHLAQGDFSLARAAAERFEDHEAVARIRKIKADYLTEVGRLQQIVATTKEPAEAARAQLWTAHAHQRAGRLDTAEQSYWKVVQRYPQESSARKAVTEIAGMRWRRGDRGGTIALCEEMLQLAPDSEAAVGACDALSEAYLVGGDTRGARERLRWIAATYPETRAADVAVYGIGEVYLKEGIPEAAEREWAALVVERTGQMERELERETRVCLAHLRYDIAMAAHSEGDLELAIRTMELVVKEPRWDRSLYGPLFILGDWYESQRRHDDALRVRQKLLLVCRTREDRLGARMRIAVSLGKTGKSEEALRMLEDILQESPPDYLGEQCRSEIELMRNPPELPGHESTSAAAPE